MPAWKGIVGKGFTADGFATYVAGLQFPAWRPSFIVLHNTGVPTFAQWHSISGDSRMQNLQSYYRDQQKWSGGPHVFVADDFIWAFTPLTVPGVHSPSWNNSSWGVELVGDYSKEIISPALHSNAISALVTLHGALGLDPSTLKLHREDPSLPIYAPAALFQSRNSSLRSLPDSRSPFPGSIRPSRLPADRVAHQRSVTDWRPIPARPRFPPAAYGAVSICRRTRRRP